MGVLSRQSRRTGKKNPHGLLNSWVFTLAGYFGGGAGTDP